MLSRAVATVGVVLVLAACDPVVVTGEPAASPTPTASPRPGAPPDGLPATLAGILARADDTAITWQEEPRPVEVAVDLAGGRPVHAAVTYLAGGADRFLKVRIDDAAVGEDRPTLAALGLLPVSAAGVEELPAPGGDLLDPVPLAAAAAPAVADCGGGEPTAVTYDTGAPYGWDGAAWASEPTWGATVAAVTEDGARTGARVDPTTGTPTADDPCFTLPALQGAVGVRGSTDCDARHASPQHSVSPGDSDLAAWGEAHHERRPCDYERQACTCRVAACSISLMSARPQRLNVTLDGERATKLAHLAARIHVNEGTLARSLLSNAIDDVDPDPASVVDVLDGIDGAHDRARLGLRQAAAGETVPLDQL